MISIRINLHFIDEKLRDRENKDLAQDCTVREQDSWQQKKVKKVTVQEVGNDRRNRQERFHYGGDGKS